MKQKCSFILKASLALVLAFVMLFGTVATSLAAVVDDLADTGANEVNKDDIYVDFSACSSETLSGLSCFWNTSCSDWGEWVTSYTDMGNYVYKFSPTNTSHEYFRGFIVVFNDNTSDKKEVTVAVPADNDNNMITINSSCNSGTWGTYVPLTPLTTPTITIDGQSSSAKIPNGKSVTLNVTNWASFSSLITSGDCTLALYDPDGTKVGSNLSAQNTTVTLTKDGNYYVKAEPTAQGASTYSESQSSNVNVDVFDVYFKTNTTGGSGVQNLSGTAMTYDTSTRFRYSVSLSAGNNYVVIYDGEESHNLSYNNGSISDSYLLTGSGFTIYNGSNDLNNPLKIVAAVAGTYNFYFDYSTNKLYVEFPHTVTFNSNGGSAVASQVVAYGGTANKPADPTKTGNTFGTWVTTDGGSTPFDFTSAITSNTTVYASWTPTSMNVTVQAMYTDDGTTYTSGTAGLSSTAGGNTITVTNNGGGNTFVYDDVITVTATAAASTAVGTRNPNAGYMLEGIYRVVNGTETSINPVTSATDTNTGVAQTMTNNTYRLTDEDNTTYTFVAKFRKVYYFNVYDSWMEDADENYNFVAAPPRTITVGTGSDVRATYTYAFTDVASNRGEDDGPQHSGTATALNIVSSTGNYYEGNLLVAYAGETIKLKYTGLADSDAIRGAFYNNNYRYTTELEDDDLYSARVYKAAGWSKAQSDDAQDYTYSAVTTLYADKAYYSSNATAYAAIKAAESGYKATINQSTHIVSWPAISNYLNIDLELDYKYQIKINDGDHSGLDVQGMNEEGFYNNGDTFPGTFKIVLDPDQDDSGTYRFTSDTVAILDDNGNAISSPSIVVTAKNSSDNTETDPADITYFQVSGTMPGQNVHLSVPVVKEYNMKLANIVISDTIGNKTMLTECTSNSTSGTGNIGTISAIVYDENGEATETNITSDGTNYYTYDGNNNQTTVNAYTDSNNNKYIKTGVNKNGSMVDARHSVIYKFAFEDGMDANYSFVGWYEGSLSGSAFTVDYSKKLSDKATFEYEPKKDTVVIAVGTRDMYLGGNFTKDAEFTETDEDMTWDSNRLLMKYDPTYTTTISGTTYRGRYYYEFNEVDANQEYRFRCYDTKAGTDTTNLTVWTNWDSSSYGQDNDDILFYRTNHGGDAKSFGSFMYKTSDASDTIGENTSPSVAGITSTKNHDALGYGAPVTVYFYAYDGGMSVKSTYQWSMAYVSTGHAIDVIDPDGATDAAKYNQPSVSVKNKTVNGEDVVVTQTTDKYGWEEIHECQVKEKDGAITITASPNDENLDLQAFLVYNIETKKSEAVTGPFTTSTVDGHTAYTGNVTIPQNTKIYVVPIYKFSDAYLEANEATMDSHTVYVRADELDKDQWGGLIAMYSWGTDTRYDSGGWPGQLLIPSPDGKTFYGELSFFKGGLAGITFNNYDQIYGSAHKMFVGTYKAQDVSTVQYSGTTGNIIYQTYDYREPISIIDSMSAGKYEDTDDVDLTFALKSGDMSAAPTIDSAGSGAYNRVSDWSKVGYLTNSAGAKVDMNGNKLAKDSTETYRIVAYYTNQYSGGSGYTYPDATDFEASYAINWTVYDTSGTELIAGTNDLSAVYTDLVDVADDGETAEWISYIAKKLIEIGEPYSGKAVKIAYENPGSWSEAVRYSGQWYYDNTNIPINANVVVGTYSDGVFKESKTGSNYESYGNAVVSPDDIDSTKGEETFDAFETGYVNKATVTKRHGNSGNISFTADNSTGNFMGWYRKNAETGEFEPVNSTTYKNTTVNLQFSSDTTFYAFYSAKAKYVFKYKDRFNNDRTYTVEGSDLTDTELGNKGTLNPTTRSADIAEKLASSKLSGIKVFNSTINYTLPEPDTSKAYSLVYNASQAPTQYKLSVYSYNASGTLEKKGDVSNTWNTPLDVTQHASLGNGTALTTNKPSDHSDYVFIGWVRYDGSTAPSTADAILSTQANFGYSITENMSIAPLFGTEAQRTSKLTDSWSTVIDKNVTTTELDSATAGTIFNDSLVAFRYGSDTGAALDISGTKECGIIIMAQDRNSSNDSAYSSAFSSAAPVTYLDALKTRGLSSAKMKSSTYGDSYAFYIKASSLSSLNRIDLVQAFDYAKFNGGNFKVMAYYYNGSGYTYSAVTSGKLVSA